MTEAMSDIERQLERDRAHLQTTLEQLAERLAPGPMLGEAARAVGGTSKRFGENLLDDVQRQPLPATLTALGLAWLAMGRGRERPGTADSAGSGLHSARSADATPEELAAAQAWDDYQEACMGCAQEPAEDTAVHELRLAEAGAPSLGVQRAEGEDDEGFKARVRDAAQRARDASRTLRERIRNATVQAGHGASAAAHATGSAAHAAGHAASSARHAAGSGIGASGRAVKDASAALSEFLDANPMVAGALGFAVGAAIGAALPLSDQEYEALHGVADEGVKKAAEGVGEAARTVRSAAEEAAVPRPH